MNVVSVSAPVDVIVNNDEDDKLRLREIVKLERESSPLLIVNTNEEESVPDRILLDVPIPLILTLSVPIDISLRSFECVPDIKITYPPSTFFNRSLLTPALTLPQGESEYPHVDDTSLPSDDTYISDISDLNGSQSSFLLEVE